VSLIRLGFRSSEAEISETLEQKDSSTREKGPPCTAGQSSLGRCRTKRARLEFTVQMALKLG
jgi:hypothetical protein